MTSTVGRVGQGRKRKDCTLPTTEGEAFSASKHTKRAIAPATVKVERDAVMCALSVAAEAVRCVCVV